MNKTKEELYERIFEKQEELIKINARWMTLLERLHPELTTQAVNRLSEEAQAE